MPFTFLVTCSRLPVGPVRGLVDVGLGPTGTSRCSNLDRTEALAPSGETSADRASCWELGAGAGSP